MADKSNKSYLWEDSLLIGKPVDIVPWTYKWCADSEVQEKAEAYFIPRRLERIDKVYRTAIYELGEKGLKSLHYDMPDLLKTPLPKPKGRLLVGLLWRGWLADYKVELHWQEDSRIIPSPEAVEVRDYPTSYGWFGWTVDRILSNPEMSEDGRIWTYKSDPSEKMDWCYNDRVTAATEMVAVFCKDERVSVPGIRIISPEVGVWKRIDVEIEWGFQSGKKEEFNGRLEPYIAVIGSISPLDEDTATNVTDWNSWQSYTSGDTRKGIIVPLLYAPDSRPGLDSRITIWNMESGFTFRISDLNNGPIFIPEHGVFITKAGSGKTARQFINELSVKKLKSIRQLTREHGEAASWEEVMQEVRLWTCPPGIPVPPFPEVEDPVMQVQIPDERWTAAWRIAFHQMRGKLLWGGLAVEVGRVAHVMDLVGLHEEADKIYRHFLNSPGVKPDGDYNDGDGALEWATSMKHDMGFSHDGTHHSTGRLLFAMSERYFLTGDKEWFLQNRVRMQKAADWIIRQRKLYMKDIPNRKNLRVAGLMPPCMLGDYALPSCHWQWYYIDNALALQGLQRFADALLQFDLEAGQKYQDEAISFRKDLQKAVELETVMSPVRLGQDGMYHSFIPPASYLQGLNFAELGLPRFFGEGELYAGALPLALPFAALSPDDNRIVSTLDGMEETGINIETVREKCRQKGFPKEQTWFWFADNYIDPDIFRANKHDLMYKTINLPKSSQRAQRGLSTEDTWFWYPFMFIPKGSYNSDIFLLQDDIPNFLRSWMNAYASIVASDGLLSEIWDIGDYSPCDKSYIDCGTAAWFLGVFRNSLVMEDGQNLWVARATPRVWLEQGKKIIVKGAPTYFGILFYEIISDVHNGRIIAVIDIPNRSPVKEVILRLRHPRAARIKYVTVNDQSWSTFNPYKETVTISGLTGKVTVIANY